MIEPNHDIRMGYTILAAASGAITSLAFMKWREMDWLTVCLTIFVGFTFALFAAPYIAHNLIGIDESDARAVSMITYTSAAGAHIILPRIVKWVSAMFGAKE